MSEIEKMKLYIERTPIGEKTAHNYAIGSTEIGAFFDEIKRDQFNAICMAYNYGRAKGYRAAKAKVRA